MAVIGSASYPSSGANGTTSSAGQTLTIAYDAGTGGYTVTVPGRSQTFLPGQKDTTLSNAGVAVYKVVSGSTTDTLALSNPGTSGVLNYKYVGSGYWQRTLQNAAATSATIDAFVYGVKTPDTALRRTGAAQYSVDMQGVLAYLDAPVSLLGTGTLSVDFETQKVTTTGTYDEFTLAGAKNGTLPFNGTATLSSTANLFTGTLTFGPSIEAGVMTGAFFGPATDEVGAVARLTTSQGTSGVATLIGRHAKDVPSLATNTDLVTLKKSVNFISQSSGVRYVTDSSGVFQGSQFTGSGLSISYNADTQTYQVSDMVAPFTSGPGAYGATFAPSSLDSSQSSSTFTAYKVSNGTTTGTFKLYKPAGSNGELALTYTGLGVLSVDTVGLSSQNWFIYGLPSGAGGDYAAPIGSATYTSKVFGVAIPNLSTASLGSLSGTATLTVNFGTGGSLTGSMSPIATLLSDRSTVNLGTYAFQSGTLNSGQPNGFSAFIQGPGDDTGSLKGLFFGNLYPEFGATFSVDTFATPAAVEYALRGAIVGKKN